MREMVKLTPVYLTNGCQGIKEQETTARDL